MCVCVCVRVRVCVRAYVRACVRVCVCYVSYECDFGYFEENGQTASTYI